MLSLLGLRTVIRRSGQRSWATLMPGLYAWCEASSLPAGEFSFPSERPYLWHPSRRFDRGFSATAVPVSEPVIYKLDIVTGDVRGAGTSTPAAIQLVGADGESSAFVIGDEDEERGFKRAATKVYPFDVGHSLGDLRRLVVRQLEADVTELGSGWFLDHVWVTGPDGCRWFFPYRSWLGKSDAGDASETREVTLLPEEVVEQAGHSPPDAPLQVATAGCVLPKRAALEAGNKAVSRKQRGWGGEDAYFVAYGRNGIVGLGVADGVHSWREEGIDSGLFSQGLMSAAAAAVEAGASDPLEVMKHCQRRVLEEGLQGSSTCCIVIIDTVQGKLMSANLGDSGFALLGRRPYHQDLCIKWHSPQQERFFGCPYQLGHHETANTAEEAQCFTISVGPGDVVILGTDGLWDNLAHDRLLAHIQKGLSAGERPPALMKRLSDEAYNMSVDKVADSPYSLAASEEFQMVYRGGKRDDITVLLATIH